jgi:transposase
MNITSAEKLRKEASNRLGWRSRIRAGKEEDMAIALPDARQLSDEVLEALRLRAVHGCELGFTEADVADLLGVSRETVCRWWSAYVHQGPDALPGDRTGRPVGTGRTLSDEQAQRLQNLIDNNSPEKLGISSPLWSRRAVQDLIHNEYGIPMPVRTVGEYLKRWGYTAKKPRRHARDQDPEEVDRWLNETYPELAGKAGEEGADILWCDETGVAADAYPGFGYAREGQRATLEVPKPHIRIKMVSAIGNGGLLRFMTYKGNMDGALFLVFLGQLLRGATRKIYPIADRLKAHDTEEVRRWLAEHKDRIELVPLPTYSPELNAVEYLNNDMKGNVKAFGLPQNEEELRSLIQSFMRKLLHLPDHVMSYFLHPCAAYAIAH